MTETARKRLEKRALLLKSLAHPARLLILELLEKAPRCVGELVGAVGSDISTVSKHISLLREAGIVRGKKRGTFVEYELACLCLSGFLECLEKGAKGKKCAP